MSKCYQVIVSIRPGFHDNVSNTKVVERLLKCSRHAQGDGMRSDDVSNAQVVTAFLRILTERFQKVVRGMLPGYCEDVVARLFS